MVAKWRNNKDTESPTWVSLVGKNNLEEKKKDGKIALSHMKSTETNLDGMIQLIVILCFHFIPFMLPKVSGLGQEFEPSNRSTGVLILFCVSPVVMLFSNIASAVSETNEGHRLSFGRKCIMGSYVLLQLFPHLFRVIPTVLASLPCIANPPCLPDEQPALSSRNAYLLITAPFLTNYMINLILMPKRIRSQTKSLIKRIRSQTKSLIRKAVLTKQRY